MSVNLDDLVVQDGGKAAVTVFRKQWTATPTRRSTAPTSRSVRRTPWSRSARTPLRLTKEEARALAKEISDLVDGWREKGKSATSSRTYEVLWVLQPAPDLES